MIAEDCELLRRVEPGPKVVRRHHDGELPSNFRIAEVGGAEEIDPPTGIALVHTDEGAVDQDDLG